MNASHPALLTTVSALAVLASSAAAQNIIDLGVLPSHTNSMARAISGDGSIVVGVSLSNASGDQRAVRWRLNAGPEDLGRLPGGTRAEAVGISRDGAVIAGSSNGTAGTNAVRWTDAGVQPLGIPAGSVSSAAAGISADGSTIIGVAPVSINFEIHYRPMSWTAAGGMIVRPIPAGVTDGAARAASADGSIIVGDVGNILPVYSVYAGVAHRWHTGGNANIGVMQGGSYSYATAISDDGAVVIGYGDFGGGMKAFRSTGAGLESLGLPGGAPSGSSLAYSMTPDGSVIVGGGQIAGQPTAWLWRADLGMVNLNTFLAAQGMNLTGWTLTECRAISADGTALCGTAQHNGLQHAWVLRGLSLPNTNICPADFNQDGGIDGTDVEAFFAAWEDAQPAADTNEDGGIDGADVETFFAAWERGGCL